MSNSTTIRDVARAAGVSISTVSFVVNGKADKYRIGHDAQARIFAAVRQLGYESKPIVNAAHFQPAPAESQDSGKQASQIVLALSTESPPDSIAMILATEPVLAAAGYQLVVIVIPADPVAARQRVSELLNHGVSGIVCCASIYSAVSTMVAKVCPVIVLWQGAGKAIVGAIEIRSGEQGVASIPKPVVNVGSAVVPKVIQPPSTPRPVVVPVLAPIVNPVRPAAAPIADRTGSDPVNLPAPALSIHDTATPVMIPAPESSPVQPVSEPDPIVIPEAPQPSSEPFPESPTLVTESVDPPPSTTEQPNNPTTNPPPALVPELTTPVSAVEPPPLEPEQEPIVITQVTPPPTPDRNTVETPTPVFVPDSPTPEITPEPVPISEPVTVIAEVPTPMPVVEPDPIVIPEAPPPPAPEPIPMEGADAALLARRSTEGGSSVKGPTSTTEQPNNLATNPPPAPVPESPTPVTESVDPPTSTTEQPSNLATNPPPAPVPESPTPVTESVDSPTSTTEQPSNLTINPPPAPVPELTTPVTESVDPPTSTTEQPNNLITNPPPESPAVDPPLTANDEGVEGVRSEQNG